MKKKIIFLLYIFIFISSFAVTTADGGFFRPIYYNEDIYEPTQKAIIIFDNVFEQLIIQATYKGDVDEFAWIVPVPSYPYINKSSPYLFEEVHYLTQPIYKRAPNLFFGSVMSNSFESLSDSKGVSVLDQKQIGIYQVTTLASDDPKALLNWLNANNYSVSPQAETVLDYYIQKKWYFIATRINLAPFDEKIIGSLKQINSSITNNQDAVDILTQQIFVYITSNNTFDQVFPLLNKALDYGPESQQEIGDYRYKNKPSILIQQDTYNRYYDQFNGYSESHAINDLTNRISQELNREVYIPSIWECKSYIQKNMDSSRCYVNEFRKDSDEYKLLSDLKCGKYCSYISEEKESYSSDDLAKVAANAVMDGNLKVKDHFRIQERDFSWYENDGDKFDYLFNQIASKLQNSAYLQDNRQALSDQLTKELLLRYNGKAGISSTNIYELSMFFAQKTLEDFKAKKEFSSSYIPAYGLLTEPNYASYKSLFEGDHNEYALRSNIKASVNDVVYWKQQTTKERLGEGTIDPLYMKFSTNEIIYPLKISSVNTGASEVLLYVFAKHRTEVKGIEGFKTEYAKWIETTDIRTEQYYNYLERVSRLSDERKTLEYRPTTSYYFLNSLLDDRYFLTKFRKEMWPKEMTDDLIIVPAKNDNKYIMTVYEPGYVLHWLETLIMFAILWGMIFGIYFLPRWINNKIIKNDTASVFYASKKRIAAYASVIPLVVIFLLIVQAFKDFMGHILEPFSKIFTFISHIFNYIGMPEIVNNLLVFIFAMAFIFLVIHLLGSAILQLFKKIKEKNEMQQMAK